ncbi:uncharacterized protein BJX67DRAFT_333499 [Aspergillus lucknowensis]|uniref:Ubiquitin 3 binding protein But2 C-terminal domain-containing protein n=1 Tax=Aspergillus lucknowensis TaxID=176173 RepID=A0ABR4LYK2_9EURO
MFILKSLAVSLLLSAAQAAPTLTTRACATVTPSVIDVLRISTPDNASPGQQFTLSRAGSPVSQTQKSALSFDIPEGAIGCMLQIQIPVLTRDNQIASGDTQADIWTTQPWTSSQLPTWRNPPQRDQFVSTFRFETQKTTTPFQTVLHSNSCSTTMSYLVELSDWQGGEGSVDFYNSPGGSEGIGFSMVYNC